jgi:hypothetical protein
MTEASAPTRQQASPIRLRSIARAALGGLWLGNIIPHVANGIVGHEYPSVLGNEPLPNALGGGLALATIPWVLGSDRSMRPQVRWTVVAVGAATAFAFHIGARPAAESHARWAQQFLTNKRRRN